MKNSMFFGGAPYNSKVDNSGACTVDKNHKNSNFLKKSFLHILIFGIFFIKIV